MRMHWFFVGAIILVVVLVGIISQQRQERARVLSSVETSLVTITGTYQCVPNPCTTRPCQPGMIWAVVNASSVYHLSVNGEWIWNCVEKTWEGYKPSRGDTVKVTGKVTERPDTSGIPFHEIEVHSLKPG